MASGGANLPRHGGGHDATRNPADRDLITSDFAGAYLTLGRTAAALSLLAAILAATMATAALTGSTTIHLLRAIGRPASPDHAIFFSVRMPRVFLGAIVGAMLAASGAALQALMRNPLAEGGILGISGGGAFGAIIALIFGTRLGFSAELVPLASFFVALLSTVAVYRLGQVGGKLEPFSLLLVGVILNAVWGAAILLINSVVNFYQAHNILFWLLGSLETPTYRETIAAGLLGACGFFLLMPRARDMNLLNLGDDNAASLGVDVNMTRKIIFLASSIMIGAAVAVSGMIGFVGLIVPHLLRLTLGSDYRLLLPASLLGGAAFLVGADLAARTIVAPAELPVGVITALCGGPFFIALLKHEGRKSVYQ